MSTLTITGFLEARIAEDEAIARAAESPSPWAVDGQRGRHWSDREASVGAGSLRQTKWASFYEDTAVPEAHPGDAEHIARHDPARVLAECAAKRTIIEQHKDWPVLVEKKPEFSEDATDINSMTCRVTQEMVWLTEREYVKRFGVEAPTTSMVKALAAVYADHADYLPEWAL